MSTYRLLQDLRATRMVLDDASASGASVDVLIELAKQVDHCVHLLSVLPGSDECDLPTYVDQRYGRRAVIVDGQISDPRAGEWQTTMEQARWMRAVRRVDYLRTVRGAGLRQALYVVW